VSERVVLDYYCHSAGPKKIVGEAFAVDGSSGVAVLYRLTADGEEEEIGRKNHIGTWFIRDEPVTGHLTLCPERSRGHLQGRLIDSERGVLDLRSERGYLLEDKNGHILLCELESEQEEAYLILGHREWRSTAEGPFRAGRILLATEACFAPVEAEVGIHPGVLSRPSALAAV